MTSAENSCHGLAAVTELHLQVKNRRELESGNTSEILDFWSCPRLYLLCESKDVSSEHKNADRKL